MRGNQLIRQWKIIQLIESRKRGRSAEELAEELETPVRTIYRDLQAIEASGFPIYNDRDGRKSYWRFTDTFTSRFPLPITTTELMSLHMSRDMLSVFEGTIFQESIESLFAKIKAVLPPETLRYLDEVSSRLKMGFGPHKSYADFGAFVSRVSDAAARRLQVDIVYRAISSGRETRRTVDPYSVWAMNGNFYLIGKCRLRDAVRTFAIDRIREMTVTDRTFVLPDDFSLEDYVQSAFRVMTGEPRVVKVRFSRSVAAIVRERVWHPTQDLVSAADGGVTVTMLVPINYEVISWILGFGAAAEVISPKTLRLRIIEELRHSLEAYGVDDIPRKKDPFPEKISAQMS